MGIGVYRDDFHGSGKTINVDNKLTDDAEYDAYVKEQEESGDHVLDREEWDQDQYNECNEAVLNVAEQVCEDLGMSSDRKGQFDGSRLSFDREFTGIASGDVFAVGWRSWGDDFVLAVGPGRNFEDRIQSTEAYAAEIVREHGMPPADLKAAYVKTLGEFEELMRLNLLKAGLQTAKPTSGYTQSRDEKPDDIDARMEALEATVKAGIETLEMPAESRIGGLDAAGRAALAKAILEIPEDEAEDLPAVLVATYAGGGGACLWQPGTGDEPGLMASATVPAEMRAHMDTLPAVEEGIAPIPLTPETEAWFASRNARSRGRQVVVSAEQWAEIKGEDCVVSWADDESGQKGTVTLASAPEPVAAPAM